MTYETEHETLPTVTEIPAIGYGNSESSISYKKQRESGELSQPVDEFAAELMTSGELLVDVNDNDDGCIDGRPTKSVLHVTKDGEVIETDADNSNHERAKVAGGGNFTAVAMAIGTGRKGESIDADIIETGLALSAKGVYCGAHTGEHGHGDGTDCGANDKMLTILDNASVYKDEIANTTKALLSFAGMEFNSETFNDVLSNWQEAVADSDYFTASTGASRLQAAQSVVEAAHTTVKPERPLSVIKHLSGDHNEDYLVVNFVKGKTISQNKLATALTEKFPELESENLAQSFVVDAWRIVELAKASVAEDEVEAAIYAGVMYQVATAATLTDGSLRTFIVE